MNEMYGNKSLEPRVKIMYSYIILIYYYYSVQLYSYIILVYCYYDIM